MKPFERITGIAAPFRQANIDTDRIVPSSELVRVQSEGYAASLFARERYLDDREPNPDFLLNRAPFDRAKILVAGENFGTGSSREAAPAALWEFGIRVVIASSFGGIFYTNCFENGVLPVELPFDSVLRSEDVAEARRAVELTVDLVENVVISDDGGRLPFRVPTIAREMLLKGKKSIELTEDDSDLVEAHWTQDRKVRPWIDLTASQADANA